jgi:hypothetical protein
MSSTEPEPGTLAWKTQRGHWGHLSASERQKLASDAIEWINRSGYTPKIYRGLSTFPVPPEARVGGEPRHLTWEIGLHYLRSPESIDPDEDATLSDFMRLTILNKLNLYKSYTVEVPEGANLQQFIREHEAEVVDPLMYTWVRTVTHKDWDNLEVEEVPLICAPLRTEIKNPELDQKVTGDQGFNQVAVDKIEVWLQEKGLEPTIRNVLQADLDLDYLLGGRVKVDGTLYTCYPVSENDTRSASGGIGLISREVVLDPYRNPYDKWLYLPHARFPEELIGTVAQRITTLVPNREGKEEILEVFLRCRPGRRRPGLYIITKFLPAEAEE